MNSEAPPRPLEGVVNWNVTTACNYRCSYCTQRFKDNRGRSAGDVEAFLEAFARLPGPWEVKLSGGEPFVHPGLGDIVAGLSRLGFRVSVVTNFSASREDLAAFVSAARGRTGVFSCSLHSEYATDLDAFIDKARWLQAKLRRGADPSLPPPHLCVTAVAVRGSVRELPAVAARFAQAGVVFKVQPEKQDRDVVDYPPDELAIVSALGGHNRTGVLAHDFRGRPCWAGSRYFILDERGEAFRCHPARRYRVERMGSVFAPGFRVADGPAPCLYSYCNCTVPIARGMMTGRPADPAAREESP